MTHENKFGMFIHWGIYAQTELHEQAIARYDIKWSDYEPLMNSFNPTEYDPEEWVLLAKRAGMKYICFTAKHHDGFCMWDTKYTDFNIMNTPYGKDVLKMLADACEKHGMLLSIYYSNPDWHHRYGYNPNATHQWCSRYKDSPDLEKYKQYIKDQITELLTGYGKIYTLFWDIPPHVEDPSINELARKLQPDIYINDRGWSEADFSTPEREYEDVGGGRFTRMTEACNSVGVESWGYRREEIFYTTRHLTSSIDRIMARGGSYLLNVGPNAKGRIEEKYIDRLMLVADWYKRMEGALECHEADEREYEIRGAEEWLVTSKNNKSYFHFPTGLISSALVFSKYPSLPKSVRLLNTNTPLPYKLTRLPECFDSETGMGFEILHVTAIPADELSAEPIVVEIEW